MKNLSEIGLGTYPFTAHWHNGQANDAHVLRMLTLAINHGINVIDTCEMHDEGRMERLVGRAIKGKRHAVAIVTKGGFVERQKGQWGNWHIDASAANITRAIDDSLQRLGTDYIDYYLSHFPDPQTPLEETIRALQQAKQAGKILEFGLSNYQAADIQKAQRLAPELRTLQHHYSLLDRTIERDILPMSQRAGGLLMAYRVLERGLLTRRFVRQDWPDPVRDTYELFQEPQLSRALEKVERLKEFAADSGHTPSQLAIRWALSHASVKLALIGVSKEEQLLEALGATGWELSHSDAAYLDQIFALRQKPRSSSAEPGQDPDSL